MMIRDLIEVLQKHDPDAEVIFPGGHQSQRGGPLNMAVEFVQEVDDAVLSDGSTYPVVMLMTD